MRTLTHVERISLVLREPGWHAATEFGPAFHTCSQRISELNAKGWNIKSRRIAGKRIYEYRMAAAI